MAVTYTQAKSTLDEIAERSEQNRKRLDTAKQIIDAAVADLNAMTSAYTAFVSDLNAAAAANPSNQAWQTAKLEKDQMVADFQALKTTAEALQGAVNA